MPEREVVFLRGMAISLEEIENITIQECEHFCRCWIKYYAFDRPKGYPPNLPHDNNLKEWIQSERNSRIENIHSKLQELWLKESDKLHDEYKKNGMFVEDRLSYKGLLKFSKSKNNIFGEPSV